MKIENCINVRIESAMKNTDITKIMHKASSKFIRSLDPDIIYTCEINALWKSLLNFKPEKNTKFTTYLYKGVIIECLKALKFEKKSNLCSKSLHENIALADTEDSFMFEILDELETEEEQELIIDKYKNLTIQEMSSKRAYSRETVRKKLKKIYSKLSENLD